MPELASSLFGNAVKMLCAQAQTRALPVQHERQTLPNLPFARPKNSRAILVYIYPLSNNLKKSYQNEL